MNTPNSNADDFEAEQRLRELTSLGIRVRDFAYPSHTTPGPCANTPAPPLPASFGIKVYFDPRIALADHDFRVDRDTQLPIDGQKTRWLIDLGWITDQDKARWREKDWKSLQEYDQRVIENRDNGYAEVQFFIPKRDRGWKGPGPPPPSEEILEEDMLEGQKKDRSCVIA